MGPQGEVLLCLSVSHIEEQKTKRGDTCLLLQQMASQRSQVQRQQALALMCRLADSQNFHLNSSSSHVTASACMCEWWLVSMNAVPNFVHVRSRDVNLEFYLWQTKYAPHIFVCICNVQAEISLL
jgi:hypothetical protein